MTEASLHDQLKTTLGECYVIERELSGGGMSRVFVARDGTFGRDVVVNVVAPENTRALTASQPQAYPWETDVNGS